MKPKTLILMVVAIGCGLGASYMTSKLLAVPRDEGPAEEQIPVLVARVRVPGWTPLNEPEKYFEVKMLAESAVPKKSLRSLEEVKGQRLNKPLDPERAAMQDDLLSKEQQSLVDSLAPGMRAIAVRVNPESLAGGFVLQGSRVDVMWTTRSSDASSQIILQSMLVLAIDMQDTRNPEIKSILGQTVTMAATPEESTRLAVACSNGELRLLPKSHGDTRRINQVVARIGDLGKPLGRNEDDEKPEGAATAPTVKPVLPVLPEEAPIPTPAPAPAVVAKSRKKHVLTIFNGASKERVVAVDGDGEDNDAAPAAPATPAAPAAPAKATRPEPEVKKEEPKANPAAPAATAAPATRSTRTRRP
jgi:pilus assembly protein CpaB